MSSDGVARVRSTVAAEALVECDRLAAGAGYAVPALAALRHRAFAMANESAQVRALGLECLPEAGYLVQQVSGLRGQVIAAPSHRRWTFAIDEVEAMLRVAIELTASIDLVRHLGVPLETVSAAQTGARAGLTAVQQLRAHLDQLAVLPTGTRIAHHSDPTHPTAGWLLGLATGVLPPGARTRYPEEFLGELAELAEEGAWVQIAHAIRLLSRAWALRRALPREQNIADPARVRLRAEPEAELHTPDVTGISCTTAALVDPCGRMAHHPGRDPRSPCPDVERSLPPRRGQPHARPAPAALRRATRVAQLRRCTPDW